MSCIALWDTFRFNHTYMYNEQFLYVYIPNILYRLYCDINYGDTVYDIEKFYIMEALKEFVCQLVKTLVELRFASDLVCTFT